LKFFTKKSQVPSMYPLCPKAKPVLHITILKLIWSKNENSWFLTSGFKWTPSNIYLWKIKYNKKSTDSFAIWNNKKKNLYWNKVVYFSIKYRINFPVLPQVERSKKKSLIILLQFKQSLVKKKRNTCVKIQMNYGSNMWKIMLLCPSSVT
jgi:hypothetical protein